MAEHGPESEPARSDRERSEQGLLPRHRTIYQRANDRGEIDFERVPAAVLTIPFDLVRHDMLMELRPLKPARIQSIVDELFLPLVRTHQGSPGRS
ncbi:TetR-like C-terminal domain-containing protein [Glaciibacter superstes]|uniref:TetR-like C-terminal domain-containing protein n=1 Tax=Glaciibacter superstes TaxID=501023 RepID=UPI0009FBF2E2